MSQHDFDIANQLGATFRSDLNSALLALASQSSGATAPSTTFAYQWWADTTTGLLKIRNAANSAWVTVGTLATAGLGLASLSANTFTATQTWAKGADVASAGALTLGSDGNYFDITGTTSITSIATKGVGTSVKLHFDAALTLTHHATDLILPGGANITTAAGDEAEFFEYTSGDWRCLTYTRASGKPVTPSGLTLVETASPTGVATDTISGIPSTAKHIVVVGSGISSSGVGNIWLRLGDAGGIEATGYSGVAMNSAAGTAANSTEFLMDVATRAAAGTWKFTAHLHLVDSATNNWEFSSQLYTSDAGQIMWSQGDKAVSAVLDSVQLGVTVGNLDAGTWSVYWE